MEEKINEILDEVRPYLNASGGDIEFVEYKDNCVYVKLTGGCAGCPNRNITVTNVIFSALKEAIPEIEKVINVEL